MFSALYFRIDVYFIEQWQGLEAVGGYNAVFRLVEAMRLLPAAVMAVTFPMLVQTTDTRLVQRIGGALAIAGVGLAVVCALGSSVIVPLVYGAPYLYAAPTFAILALALPLFFLNYALTHQVIGWDGQRAYLLIAIARARRQRRRQLRAGALAGNHRRRHRHAADRSRRHRGLPATRCGFSDAGSARQVQARRFNPKVRLP